MPNTSHTPDRPRKISLLQRVQVASPCPARWDEMDGDDRSRFCHQCNKHVYNFAAMSEAEANRLLEATEGGLCGRIYRRADGTILTSDCPVGVARLRRAFRRTLAVCAGVALAMLSGMGVAVRAVSHGWEGEGSGSWLAETQPVRTLVRWSKSPAPVVPFIGAVAGEIMYAPNPTLPNGPTDGGSPEAPTPAPPDGTPAAHE